MYARPVGASEADVDVLAYQFDTGESLSDRELEQTIVVDTETDVDVSAVVAQVRMRAGLT